jgi:hypothetical protein
MAPTYIGKCSFPDAVRVWSQRPYGDHPADKAPPGFLHGVDIENRELARIFSAICALPTTAERMILLQSAIERGKRHILMLEADIRGESNPRKVGSMDRSGWAALKPMQEMVRALELWASELHEAWMNEIGVGFIDQAAHARAS